MSIGLILIIILVIFLFGGFSGRFGGYGYGYGHGGMGIIGVGSAHARFHAPRAVRAMEDRPCLRPLRKTCASRLRD